jgi:tetratricopeptide (TPR) repeat protein
MSKTGRNQQCPCGSGKKYKLCCQRSDQAAQPKEEPAQVLPRGRGDADLPEDDDLEQLDSHSNHVVDLIHMGRLDEAEAAARQLLARYPGFMDGHLRLAMVHQARQQPELAAAQYRSAAACLGDDCEELRTDLLRQADKLASAD